MDVREVLKQLAEKKITVDEAYKKIKEEKRVKPLKISGIHVEREEKREDEKHGIIDVSVPAKKKGYGFRISEGRVVFRNTESDSISIRGSGDYRLSDDSVELRGDFEIHIPSLVAYSIKSNHSEVRGNLKADVFNLSILDSIISLSVDSRIVNISNQGGNSDIRLTSRLKVLNVSSKLGSLKIGLPRSLRSIYNLKEREGRITVEAGRKKWLSNLIAGSGAPAVINISAKAGTVLIYDTGREPDKDIQEQGTRDQGS